MERQNKRMCDRICPIQLAGLLASGKLDYVNYVRKQGYGNCAGPDCVWYEKCMEYINQTRYEKPSEKEEG